MNTKTPIQVKYVVYEKRVQSILLEHGFDCRREPGDYFGADLLADDVPVEVKGSMLHPLSSRQDALQYMGYQFLLWKSNYSRRITEPITILYCHRLEPVLFIIPTPELSRYSKISIPNADPNRYAGKWSAYRDNFAVLREIAEKKMRVT